MCRSSTARSGAGLVALLLVASLLGAVTATEEDKPTTASTSGYHRGQADPDAYLGDEDGYGLGHYKLVKPGYPDKPYGHDDPGYHKYSSPGYDSYYRKPDYGPDGYEGYSSGHCHPPCNSQSICVMGMCVKQATWCIPADYTCELGPNYLATGCTNSATSHLVYVQPGTTNLGINFYLAGHLSGPVQVDVHTLDHRFVASVVVAGSDCVANTTCTKCQGIHLCDGKSPVALEADGMLINQYGACYPVDLTNFQDCSVFKVLVTSACREGCPSGAGSYCAWAVRVGCGTENTDFCTSATSRDMHAC